MAEMMNTPRHIVAKPIYTSKKKKLSNRRIWATICYYYPQYTLEEASKLSVRDINLLIHTANKIEAERLFSLTQIVAAPHTKKGSGVKKLTETFKKAMEE